MFVEFAPHDNIHSEPEILFNSKNWTTDICQKWSILAQSINSLRFRYFQVISDHISQLFSSKQSSYPFRPLYFDTGSVDGSVAFLILNQTVHEFQVFTQYRSVT